MVLEERGVSHLERVLEFFDYPALVGEPVQKAMRVGVVVVLTWLGLMVRLLKMNDLISSLGFKMI